MKAISVELCFYSIAYFSVFTGLIFVLSLSNEEVTFAETI